MKKFLTVVGALFLLLLVAVGVFISFAAHEGSGLDASSKAYVEENVPPIISTWSKEELLKRASPELLKVVNEHPDQLEQLFQKLSKLGALKTFTDVKGDSRVFYDANKGKSVTAEYKGAATFANGKGDVLVRLVQHSGQWQLQYFYVNSPIFLAQ